MEKYTFEPNEELVAFAETFSENWNIVGVGDYVSPGDKKYHIKYEEMILENGVEPTTNIVVHKSGAIIISKAKLQKYETNNDYIFFMILWCIVLKEIGGDHSKADLITMDYYLRTGRLPKNVLLCYISLFSAGHTELKHRRIQDLIDFINLNKRKSFTEVQKESTCQKRTTVCEIYDEKGMLLARESNRCNPEGGTCHRLEINQDKANYDKESQCNWTHAEINAIAALQKDCKPFQAIIYGHTFFCDACEEALRKAGVTHFKIN